MKVRRAKRITLILLFAGLPGLICFADEPAIQVAPMPAPPRESQPVPQTPGGNAPLSIDTLSNTQDYMRYEPYNTFPRELDLWNLEGKKQILSDVVVSPDRRYFAYSEVIFMPRDRQTLARLYLVPVPPLPPPKTPRLPSEEATEKEPDIPPSVYYDRFDPTKHLKDRKILTSLGYNRIIPYGFQTLTVVDWSANSKKLLYKQKTGILHLGLRTSDIWVYDMDKGVATIYPAVHRVIKHYWQQRNLPHIHELAWDIQPLGWEPDSDQSILLKAWAYDKEEKKFLGLWRYDVDAGRTRLVSLEDAPVPVAANGWLVTPVPVPTQK